MAPCAGKKRMEVCLCPLWGFTSISSHFGCGTYLAQQVTYRSKWRWKMDGSRSACFMRQFVREAMNCSEQADTLLPHKGYSVSLVHLATAVPSETNIKQDLLIVTWTLSKLADADFCPSPSKTTTTKKTGWKKLVSTQRDSCHGSWIVQVSALKSHSSSILPNSDKQHFPTSNEWSDSSFENQKHLL